MTALDTRRVSLPNDGIAYWLTHDSPTTQKLSSDGFHCRCIVWDTGGGQPSALYSGKRMISIVSFKLVTGNPGRFCDWHTQPSDQPWSWSPRYGPEPSVSSNAVAGLALDYFGGIQGSGNSTPQNSPGGLVLRLQPEEVAPSNLSASNRIFYQVFTQAQIEARRNQWVDIWLDIGLGRSDTAPDGYVKLWVAGEDLSGPRINVSNINTHWFAQHQVVYIQGAYHSSGSPNLTIDHVATRFGRTPQEAYLDVPGFNSGFNAGTGSPGSSSVLSSRQHDAVAIPSDLDWTGGGGGGPADTTAPALTSVAILGSGSSLIYDEPLDQASEPAPGDYAYLVNGNPRAVTSVNVVGTRVDCFLTSPVVAGDTVTVSYTRAGGREVKDTAGNLAANLSGQAVSNNTPAVPSSSRTTVVRATAIARTVDPGAHVVSGALQTILTPPNAGDDGWCMRSDANYATVTGGGGAFEDNSGETILYARRTLLAGVYYIGCGLVRFDSSGLPDDATITSASLELYLHFKNDTDALSLVGDYYDFGGTPVVAADWANPPDGSALSVTLASLVAGQINAIPLSNLSSISKTGFTGIRVGISKRASDAAPTGQNRAAFSAVEHETTQEPRLVIAYTLPGGGGGV